MQPNNPTPPQHVVVQEGADAPPHHRRGSPRAPCEGTTLPPFMAAALSLLAHKTVDDVACRDKIIYDKIDMPIALSISFVLV